MKEKKTVVVWTLMLTLVCVLACSCKKTEPAESPESPVDKMSEINARLTYWCLQAERLPREVELRPEEWHADIFVKRSMIIQRRISELQKEKRQRLNSFGPAASCTLSDLPSK